jgi:hypothetical protein
VPAGKIVSVTRILNEDDIVEAFTRHNATHLDHLLFLDNGSTDRTLEILKSLQSEGFPLTVFQSRALTFEEAASNTWAYQLASQLHHAAWVIFLDADEFIAAPAAIATLLPGTENAISLPLLHYGQTGQEDPAEPIVPVRMRWRLPPPTHVHKILLRGNLGPDIAIAAGNHGASSTGQPLAATASQTIALAHYPRRNGYQNLQKILLGRLKTLAAGQPAIRANHAAHYISPAETLREKPWELVANPAYLAREFPPEAAEEAPLAYLGGPLRYWHTADPAFKALQLALRHAEQLAAQHGRLLDESPQARSLVERWNARRDFLF